MLEVTCAWLGTVLWKADLEFATVRLLREELQLLQEPGSYVGEIVKVMGKNKVLVKVQPEGKYSTPLLLPGPYAQLLTNLHSWQSSTSTLKLTSETSSPPSA